jgi:rare lipoprotein A
LCRPKKIYSKQSDFWGGSSKAEQRSLQIDYSYARQDCNKPENSSAKSIMALTALLLCTMFLAACSTYHGSQRDGAPNFYVDVSKIKDAVPKVEPPCRFGNPSSYVVRGQRYYVKKNATGYDERGIASWYGTLFHKHRTSCGEAYNMLSMTAASKTLPLPTYAEVTNLQNGKRVIVKVNDRGPFAQNRIMDLSWVAAKKLGITGKGTGYVEVRAINPYTWHHDKNIYTSAPKPTLVHPGRPIIFLQVGAFTSLIKAKQIAHHLITLTHRPVRIQIKHAKQTLYRVQIGPVLGVGDTDSLSHTLVKAGFSEPITVIY